MRNTLGVPGGAGDPVGTSEPRPIDARWLWYALSFFGWAMAIRLFVGLGMLVAPFAGLPLFIDGQFALEPSLANLAYLAIVALPGALAWFGGRYFLRRGAPSGIWVGLLLGGLPFAPVIYTEAASWGRPVVGIVTAAVMILVPPAVVVFHASRLRAASSSAPDLAVAEQDD
jgi:hypothetical protein